jgi:diaminopimelate epimerase
MAHLFPFEKMHGLGNDFVIVDARKHSITLPPAAIQAMANRKTGIGFDQMIVLSPAADADCFMTIYNADSSEVDACGNATRCVARLMMEEHASTEVRIRTNAGLLLGHADQVPEKNATNWNITVNMGEPRLAWQDIPLASPQDTTAITLEAAALPADLPAPVRDVITALPNGVCVNMGNPHVVFFVADANAIDLDACGPYLEHHPLFPARTNVEFVHIVAPHHLRMRVWERGAGITQACGTGACAVGVAAVRRGMMDGAMRVDLDGGTLTIEWRDQKTVWMTGFASKSFTGSFDAAAYGVVLSPMVEGIAQS